MALFSNKCSSCGHDNPTQTSFCAQCGTPMGGREIICGACNTRNRSDSHYCKECGWELSAAHAAPEIRDQRWSRREGDFAVRIEADDLPGLLRRGIAIQVGTNAMLIEDGADRGMLGPGNHTLDSLDDRLLNWISLRHTKKVSILLVDVNPAELEFNLGGIFTKDPIRIGMSVRIQAQVEQPARFLIQMLANRERYSLEDLRMYLYPEVANTAENWVSQHNAQELGEDLRLKEKLELTLEEALRPTLARLGLRFISLRTFDINLEHLDRIKGIRSSYALQVTESEAEVQGKQRLVDIMKQLNLQKLAEETAKVEDEERHAELYQRMRQAIMAGRMDDVRSEAEFNAFLNDIDRQKLLREKERTDLLGTWKEESDDRERARSHVLAKLYVEREYELRAIDFQQRTDFSEKELEAELRMERMRAGKQFEIDAAKSDYELNRRRSLAEFESRAAEEKLRFDEMEQKSRRTSNAEDADEKIRQFDKEIDIGLKGLRGIKQVRLESERGQWELEQQKTEFQWSQRQKELEIEMQRERIRMDLELNRLDKLGELGIEALIAASPVEQGKILADLKKTESLRGMTEEQILAAAAKDSPDVAHALAEKYKAIAEGKSGEMQREMYEKLLVEKETRERASIDAWDKASSRAKETTERALDRMAETAQAFARGQSGTPVVITDLSGVRSASSTGGPPTGTNPRDGSKNCPKCGRFVQVDAHFCLYCGNKFEGAG